MTGLTFADVRDLVERGPTPDEQAAIRAYRYRRDVERHAAGCLCQMRGGRSCRELRSRVPWRHLDD